MMLRWFAVLLLARAASADDKPFNPPKLRTTPGIKAEASTSAQYTLEDPAAKASSKNTGSGGGMLGRLTPYEWSGKAAMTTGESAPAEPAASTPAKARRVGIRTCNKGYGPVSLDGKRACCPLNTWFNAQNGGCWETKGDCTDGRKSARCVQATEREQRSDLGETEQSCPAGQVKVVRLGICCPSEHWSHSGAQRCYPDEETCSARSGNLTCFQNVRITR